MAITKIDDSTIGVVQPVGIADIQARITSRNQAIADYQATIATHTKNIQDLQTANDADTALLKQASSLGVADATTALAPPVVSPPISASPVGVAT